MEYKDYYKILGVPKSATTDDIKKAYRSLARKYHPDLNQGNPGAEAKFKEVNEAHEVLGNEQSRRQYDELGANWKAYSQQPPNQGAQNYGGSAYHRSTQRGPFSGGDEDEDDGPFGGFSDFFRQFFGGAGGSGGGAGSAPGDLKAQLTLSLEEAWHGGPKLVRVGNDEIRLTLKPGVPDGLTLKIPGKGAEGRGGQRGNLFLKMKIGPHPVFERKENHLHAELAIPLPTAVLGGNAHITLLDGKQLQVKVPAGAQPGGSLRLRGKGMPLYDNPGMYGDLLLKLKVEVPKTLTPQQRALYEQLQALDK